VAWIGFITIVVTMWAAIVVAGFVRQSLNEAERVHVAESTAKGFSEYVGLHLLIVDRLLLSSRDAYARAGQVPPHEDLARDLGQMAPMLLQVAIADATGSMVASSLPLKPGLSIADRPHFKVFADDPTDRLHVSQPVVGRVSGRMSLQLVRPIRDAQGGFAGVIVASIDPVKLQRYFGQADAFEDDGNVKIVGRTDGVVRARFTHAGITWGQSMLPSSGWTQIASLKSGVFEGNSPIDGVNNVVGFHQIGEYPLTTLVSMRVPEWPWDEMALTLGIGVLVSAYAFLYTRTRVRRMREKEQVIEQLRISNEREQEASRLKSRFLASVSHELRTPLNSIIGFSELIRERPADAKNERYASLILSSGEHLLSLLNALLDTAKIEAGRMEIHRTELDLSGLLRNLVDLHRGAAERKGLTFALDMPDGPAVVAHTDATRITQVLNNVLNNAVKFTATGGVRVALALQDDTATITVADSGCGIPDSEMPKLFDRFSTVRREDEQEGSGSGLGLALSRDLMQLLGGTIMLQSRAGEGTVVTLRLPLQPDKETPS
jgi:signal transduction histidine kinase